MAQVFKVAHGLSLQPPVQNEDARARAVSKQYEEYFLDEMVKAMRKTIVPAQKPTFAQQLYRQQLDQQYVDKWSQQGGVGLAQLIYNQLKDRYLDPNTVQPIKGPIPINKNVRFKIEKNKKPLGIPLASPQSSKQKELSFLYEWNDGAKLASRDVTSPLDAEVLQAFRHNDDRQTVKLAHDNGLVSTLSFVGHCRDLVPGERLSAGEKLGTLAPTAQGLAWQINVSV